ncbi:Cyclin-D-binding Myb-like transcription factor 1 [Linum grandiflorum]
MVNGEAGSTEFVSRMEEGNSRKKRKRVEGNNSADSSSGLGLSEAEHGVGSLNRIEVGKSDSTKRRKKKKRKKHVNDQEVPNEELGDAWAVAGRGKHCGGKDRSETVNLNSKSSNDKEEEEEEEEKKKKKKKKVKHNIDTEAALKEARVRDIEADGKYIRYVRDSHREQVVEKSEKEKEDKEEKKKKKKEKKKKKREEEEKENKKNKNKNKKKKQEEEKKKKQVEKDKKKKQLVVQEPEFQEKSVGDDEAATKELENTGYSKDKTTDKKRKKKKQTSDVGKRVEINTDALESSPPKSTSNKRVSFSEDLEVFPISNDDDSNDETTSEDKELVRGKRFSPEEDKLVEEACWEYVHSKDLGEEGIKMILNCKKHKQVRNCWKEISTAIPWRPRESVRYRAHILFERGETGKWTEEEYELVLKHHKEHGAAWKALAQDLGKHRFHVKDQFRRLKFPKRKKGHWTTDEYEKFFDLVNTDLQMKAHEERKSKHGMLKDNIGWTAISEKLETRTHSNCSEKWYKQLASPMVAQNIWCDTDDYHLVIELYNLDACCMEDVDWDCLLEHRSGEVCRKRWNEMVKYLGDCRNKSFSEQVEVLAKRYTPVVLEAREAYYSKPIVD